MKIVMSKKLQDFTAQRTGEETIAWSLYHFKNLAAGAQPSKLSFFNTAIGQQDGDISAVATQEDTNMQVANMLPSPERMLVTRICVPVVPHTSDVIPVGDADNGATESTVDDVARLINRGFFEFVLLTKPYLQMGCLGMVPAGMGMSGALAAATTNSTLNLNKAFINNGDISSDAGYRVLLPLETQTTFSATISFPKGAITTAKDLRVGVILHGYKYRPEQ